MICDSDTQYRVIAKKIECSRIEYIEMLNGKTQKDKTRKKKTIMREIEWCWFLKIFSERYSIDKNYIEKWVI